MTHTLPFPALVGLEAAQQALILLAIEPRLRGLVLMAPAGSGKSSLARGIREVLADDAMPFVELPPSVDTENLLGGIDLQATLHKGKMILQDGILARADGGMVYVDGINLLTDATSNLLLSVLDEGVVQIEREGVSLRQRAQFSLIGSYDPAEGMPRQHLIDRVGLIASLSAQQTLHNREQVLRRNLLMSPQTWADDLDFVRGMIRAAREQLPQVTIEDEQIGWLSQLALRYGVEGHRADLFAVWAACASAASELRDSVESDDLEIAARLVILPRATRIPEQEADDTPTPPSEPQQDQTPPPDQTPEPPNDHQDDDEPDDTPEQAPPDTMSLPPEQVLEALMSELPEMLTTLPYMNLRRGQSGSRGTTEGKRGRHIRSVQGDARRHRIDVIASLRAGAPWQALRASQSKADDTRRVRLLSSDLRVKRYRSKAGALFCFGVDASGSMALHRMRQAKGAVHALLEKAYVKRDRVALLAFRGEQAELLMPPTQSVELARRALDLLPTGGGTPLASALMLACDIAQQARLRGIMQTMLILLTDGRGNVPLQDSGNPQDELQSLSGYVQAVGLHVVVVDTKRNYLSRGEARQLAEWLGADYAYLPNASSEDIANLVTEIRD
ncbi:MAG: magnesium chelatase ATPase subunit D [Anaerolineae bacterium]